MEKKRDWTELGRLAGAMISFLVTAISLGSIWLSVNPKVPWSFIALISFIIFAFLVWKWISGLDSELNSRTPKIGIHGDPIPHDVGMGRHLPDSTFEPIAISNMAAVLFSNNPKYITNQNSVNGVRAEITYFDENRNILFGPIQGRWGQTSQPSEIKKSESALIESVDFPNNGAIRSLDFIIKYPEDEFCYAFNNDSYDFPYLFQNPSYVIQRKKFVVQIKLKGPYISDDPFEFEVITEGKNDTYKIRKRDGEWQKLLNSQATKALKKAEKMTKKKSSRRKNS